MAGAFPLLRRGGGGAGHSRRHVAWLGGAQVGAAVLAEGHAGPVVGAAARASLGALRRLRSRDRGGRAGRHQALPAVAAEGDARSVLGAAARALGALARLGAPARCARPRRCDGNGRGSVRLDLGWRRLGRRPARRSAHRLGGLLSIGFGGLLSVGRGGCGGSWLVDGRIIVGYACRRFGRGAAVGRPARGLELVRLVRRRLRRRLVGRGVGRVALVVLHRAVQPPSGPGATPVMIAARRRPAELPASARASAAAAAHRSRRPRPPTLAPGAASGLARCLPD